MIRGEANARFQGRYRVAITLAAGLAAMIHLAGALGAPPYAPTPYAIPAPTARGWETPPAYEPVVPPPPVPRPVFELVPGDPDTPDLPFPDTLFDDIREAPPVGRPGTPDDFVAWTDPPKLLRRVAPTYPDLARQAEATGTVHLLVTIDATGRVTHAEVHRSTAIGSLEAAALRAVYEWLFTPAMQRDKPVECTLVIPFVFSLR